MDHSSEVWTGYSHVAAAAGQTDIETLTLDRIIGQIYFSDEWRGKGRG